MLFDNVNLKESTNFKIQSLIFFQCSRNLVERVEYKIQGRRFFIDFNISDAVRSDLVRSKAAEYNFSSINLICKFADDFIQRIHSVRS